MLMQIENKYMVKIHRTKGVFLKYSLGAHTVMLINVDVHSFNQYLLNANYVLATVDKIMNKTKCLCLCYNLVNGER